jgi:hypothetical protein
MVELSAAHSSGGASLSRRHDRLETDSEIEKRTLTKQESREKLAPCEPPIQMFRLGSFGLPFGRWRFCRLFVANSDCSGSSGSSPLPPVPMKITRVSANTREIAFGTGNPPWNARFNSRTAYFDNQADLPSPNEIAKWICTHREV